MKAELIGAIRRTVLRDIPQLGTGQGGFVRVDWEHFANTVMRGFIMGQREDLDESFNWGENFKGNRDYAQWLNYFSVEDGTAPIYDTVLNPYMRAREGNGESDLHGRGSCMPGGHLDAIDLHYVRINGVRTSIPDLLKTSLYNIMREAFEEMTFVKDGEPFQAWEQNGLGGEYLAADLSDLSNFATLHFEGIIFDNSDNVGRLHIAIAWRLRLRSGVTVTNREKGVDFIPAVYARDLYTAYPGVKFENWTRLFVEHLNSLQADDTISPDYLADYSLEIDSWAADPEVSMEETE